MRNIVVGIGEALWDMLPQGKKLGGAPANFAYHVGQFGFQTCVISALGADDLGKELKCQIEGKKLNYIMEEVPFPTGTVQVTLDDKGIPQYEIKQGVAWDNIPYTAALEELAAKTKAVCFGSLAQRSDVSANTIKKFVDTIPDEDCYKIFDINLRQKFYTKEVLEDSINRSNILKINDEEIEIVSDIFGLDKSPSYHARCIELLEKFNLKIVILTCGVDGSYVFTKDESSFFPTPKVDVADTVGAGDSFTAAFVASLLQGKGIVQAHKKATEVAAYICTQDGAMPILPTNLSL